MLKVLEYAKSLRSKRYLTNLKFSDKYLIYHDPNKDTDYMNCIALLKTVKL